MIMRRLLASVLLMATTAVSAASIPNLEFPLKNGTARDQLYKMSEHPNTVFVFEAFGINCGYCHENAAAVDAMATEFAGNPRVQVLDLGLDTTESAFEEWIARHEPNHPVVQDTGRKVYNALHTANGIPQVFIVNCRGEMVGNFVGTWAGSTDTIRGYINSALRTTCAN
jgi:peroxiredoxin